MATAWDDSRLHKVGEFGAVALMGAGNFGQKVWLSEAETATAWDDSRLHKVGEFGAVAPMGAGNFGEKVWEVSL